MVCLMYMIYPRLVESMGYKKECDMESRAVSAMTVISSVHSTPAIEVGN